MDDFIRKLPKAELHVHFDGTLEPEQMFLFAQRNKISLPYTSPEEVKTLYKSMHKNQFLMLYNVATTVLRTEQDFYELTLAYLQKAAQQGVLHTEIFFDTQTFTARGIQAEMVMYGIEQALNEGERKLGITSFLILCFLRHLSEEDAFVALENSLHYRSKIVGVGLAANAQGNPPSKFERVFRQARKYGYKLTIHAGEDDGPAAIYEAINLLKVDRIDHGVQCWQDSKLVKELVKRKIPLTVCPLSNIALGVYPRLEDHPLKKMLDAGLLVSINSDDPAYFGGYIADNYQAVHEALHMSYQDLIKCAEISFRTSFLDDQAKGIYLNQLAKYINENIF